LGDENLKAFTHTNIKRFLRWLVLAVGLLIPLIALACSASNPNNDATNTPSQESVSLTESNEAPTLLEPAVPIQRAPLYPELPVLRPHPNSSERSYTQEEVIQLIHHWSEYFSVPVEHPLRIAKCESNYRWDAKNQFSSASGVFQYLERVWARTPEGKAGLSVFDADANIRAAIRHMSVHGYDAWECK